MAVRKTPFATDEWYHCYNRGVDKRIVFQDKQDYFRFLEQLYLTNNNSPLRHADLGSRKYAEILKIPRKERLVAVGAYCLMPNHFHLVLKEIMEGGVSKFMQKLGTAYTMYFNTRYDRVGNLFVKPFRSRHVANDRYFQHLINYVHCNPAELFEPKWKMGKIENTKALVERLVNYSYSSLGSYLNETLPSRAILDESVFSLVNNIHPKKMVQEATKYFLENPDIEVSF